MSSYSVPLSDELGRVNEFLDLVKASGLISERNLAGHINDFCAPRGNPLMSTYGFSVTGISSYFVHRKALTCWQVQRLRQGRYKGFFFEGEYCLLDHLASGEYRCVYMAMHVKTYQVVSLEICPPGPDGKCPYRILRVLENSRW